MWDCLGQSVPVFFRVCQFMHLALENCAQRYVAVFQHMMPSKMQLNSLKNEDCLLWLVCLVIKTTSQGSKPKHASHFNHDDSNRPTVISKNYANHHRGSHILSSWMVHAGCVCVCCLFFFPAFAHLGHECQDLLSLCNGMDVYTD